MTKVQTLQVKLLHAIALLSLPRHHQYDKFLEYGTVINNQSFLSVQTILVWIHDIQSLKRTNYSAQQSSNTNSISKSILHQPRIRDLSVYQPDQSRMHEGNVCWLICDGDLSSDVDPRKCIQFVLLRRAPYDVLFALCGMAHDADLMHFTARHGSERESIPRYGWLGIV